MPLLYPELRLITLDGNEDSYILTEDSFYKNLWGNAGGDTLQGNSSDNVINGDAGDDTMIGGAGNDTYGVYDEGDVIIEHEGGGTDTVMVTTNYTLSAFVENMILRDNAIRGTGNAQANAITGHEIDNVLFGEGGDDTLDGGAGADYMDGGTGNDVFIVDSEKDVVVEAAGGGYDTVHASISFSLADKPDIEAVVLTGFAAIDAVGNDADNSLTGNDAANVLIGGLGNDVLNGRGGADYMDGGDGDDTYHVDQAGDAIQDSSGVDTVVTTASYGLASYLENLMAAGSDAIGLFGNDLANTITGNAAQNTITAGLGNDTVNGGYGNDTLSGGAGKDFFVFDSALNKKGNVDKITDFKVKDDTVWLDNAIFTKLSGGSALSPKMLSSKYFTIGSKAQDKNDFIVYDSKTGYLSYDADGSGKGAAVLFAKLSKNLKMTNKDLFVI